MPFINAKLNYVPLYGKEVNLSEMSLKFTLSGHGQVLQ